MKCQLVVVIILAAFSCQTLGYPASVEDDLETNDPKYGDFYEGDMELSPSQITAVEGTSRNIMSNPGSRWPNATVFYRFADPNLDADHKNQILRGMQLIENASCIRFVPHTTQSAYVNIDTKPTVCHSSVGYSNRRRNVNLAYNQINKGCFRMSNIVHEFLHTLGFFHQHSAYNRDEYVEIQYENIRPGKENSFKKHSPAAEEDFGVEYEYASVMHYGAAAFSKNGKRTIVPIKDKNAHLGNKTGMTKKDILKLNLAYKCPRK